MVVLLLLLLMLLLSSHFLSAMKCKRQLDLFGYKLTGMY
jgi:hypothetical protein